MKKSKRFCLSLLGTLLTLGLALNAYGFEISIDVAPNVLNVRSQAQVVTVHTDVSYWAVDAHTVYLNDVAINSWKSDDRGYFVAKFLMEEIEGLPGLVYGEYNEFMLEGTTNSGESFWGMDEILVVYIQPKGQ